MDGGTVPNELRRTLGSGQEEVAWPRPAQLDSMLVETLQGWHKARERASRYNRNLLQYAAAMAAVAGIGAGSGAIYAVAESLETAGRLAPWALGALAAVAMVTGIALVLLGSLALCSYRQRGSWEDETERRLQKLIEIAPERFEPANAE